MEEKANSTHKLQQKLDNFKAFKKKMKENTKINLSFFIRQALWIILLSILFIVIILAMDTFRPYHAKNEKFFDQYNNARTRSLAADDDNILNCPRRVDKVMLFIIDNLGFEKLFTFKNLSTVAKVLKRVKDDKNRSRIFKVESEGLLLTNSALTRILFGTRGSLIEGFNNRSPLTKIYNFSLLKQLNDIGIRTSHVGSEIWKVLFQGSKYNILGNDYKPGEDLNVNDVFKFYNESDFVVLHTTKMDKIMHIYGTNSPEAVTELNKSIELFIKSLEELDKKNENVLILLTGDHYSTGYTHGLDIPRQKVMPLVSFTNFDGLFPYDKNNDSNQENDNVNIRITNQINMAPTLSQLFGAGINTISEGVLIKEFFRDSETSDYLQCYFKQNQIHLNSVYNRRIWSANIDEMEDYSLKNKEISLKLQKVPKLDGSLIKLSIVVSTAMLLLSLTRSLTIFPIVTISIVLVGFLIMKKKYFAAATAATFSLAAEALILIFTFATKKCTTKYFRTSYAPFLCFKIIVIVFNLTSSLSMRTLVINRLALVLIGLIVPVAFFLIQSDIPALTQLKTIGLMAMSFTLLILLIGFSRWCKQTMDNKICTQNDFNKNVKLIPGVCCLVFVIAYMIIDFKNVFKGGTKKSLSHLYLVIGIVFAVISLEIWVMRYEFGSYTYGKRHLVVGPVLALHLLGILCGALSIIACIYVYDINLFAYAVIYCAIFICLGTYEIRYSIAIASMLIVMRIFARPVRLIPLYLKNHALKIEERKTLTKISFFYLTFVMKSFSFLYYFYLGRNLSFHHLYSMRMSFQMSLDDRSHIHTRFYGVLTSFAARILAAIFISPEFLWLFQFNLKQGVSKIRETSIFSNILDFYIVFQSSQLLGFTALLYYEHKATPLRTWNESELYVVLSLVESMYDMIIEIVLCVFFQIFKYFRRVNSAI